MQDTFITTRANTKSGNDLIDLAAPLLRMMMKIKAGVVTPSNEMRRQIDDWFKKLEERGSQSGYKERQLLDVKFALAAFVDETVLAGGFPLREEWERYPLQLEYFREALAGNKYFERLDSLIKQGEAEVVEVYYLCLLIGFKGKYSVFLEDQLPNVINSTAEYLRGAGRLLTRTLSPHGFLNDQPEPPPPEPELPRWVKLSAIAAVSMMVFAYLILNWSLISTLEDAMKESLLK
jgi:type VI secretion system protein ImpK